ncbi:MAG TPA: hypothetical protein VF589_09435, partial [Allosphingosinicella sp.]
MTNPSPTPRPPAPPAAEPPASAPFTPVELRARHDGWTPTRQREFVEALAICGCVVEAAARTGMTEQSAYRLRLRPDAGPFAAAWDAALVVGKTPLASIAWDRAINGTATPIFYKGEQVGERRHYSDKLLLHLLGNTELTGRRAAARDAVLADWDGWMEGLEHGFPQPEPQPEPEPEPDGPPQRIITGNYWMEDGIWYTDKTPAPGYTGTIIGGCITRRRTLDEKELAEAAWQLEEWEQEILKE